MRAKWIWIPALLFVLQTQAQTAYKVNLFYQPLLKGQQFIGQSACWGLGFGQYLNSHVFMSVDANFSLFSMLESINQPVGAFNSVTITYKRPWSLDYEVKYFFNEDDGIYLASGISYRTVRETSQGYLGTEAATVHSIPYVIKFGDRMEGDYYDFFVDYYIGVCPNMLSTENRKLYDGKGIIYPKVAPMPLILGASVGYVF